MPPTLTINLNYPSEKDTFSLLNKNPVKEGDTVNKFGSTSDPYMTAAAAERAEMAEEMDGKGNFDPDKLLQCPFDKNHQIRSCRFPYHLIKCRKNHPKLASELKTCPFNARHLVPKHKLAYCD
ncbi:hypothetical protein PAMA_008907 [Pampus argenteus]